MNEKQREILKKLSTKANSKWLKEAEFRIKNRVWLGYSSKIALRIMAAMEDIEGMTKATLAKEVEIKPEKLQKILKGQENLSLKLIAKFEEVLKVKLISFPFYKYQIKDMTPQKNKELDND